MITEKNCINLQVFCFFSEKTRPKEKRERERKIDIVKSSLCVQLSGIDSISSCAFKAPSMFSHPILFRGNVFIVDWIVALSENEKEEEEVEKNYIWLDNIGAHKSK